MFPSLDIFKQFLSIIFKFEDFCFEFFESKILRGSNRKTEIVKKLEVGYVL